MLLIGGSMPGSVWLSTVMWPRIKRTFQEHALTLAT